LCHENKNTKNQISIRGYGEVIKVNSLKEAESKLRSSSMCEISISYITRKDFDEKGKLIEEYFVG
jgi:hypothetical protein